MLGRKPLFLLALPYLLLLATTGVLGPDEPRYAAIGRSMADSLDFITPRLWGSPWFEKPPLLYWLIALGNLLHIPPDWAARIPVALLGLGLLWLLPTLEAALILGTSLGWLALSQVATTDIPLAFCFNAWLLLMLRNRPWLAGAFLGAAVLAKGLVPLVFALPVAFLYRREWRHWVTTVAIAAPWYAACWLANGRPFFDEFIWRHHVLRFISPEIAHVQPFWFYLPALIGLSLPWAPAILHLRKPTDEERPFLYTLVFGFVFLSASRNKLATYLLPLLPSLAILIAPRLRRWHFAFAAGILALLPIASPWLGVAIEQGLSKADFRSGLWLWALAVPAFAYSAWRWRLPAVLAAFVIAVSATKLTSFPEIDAHSGAKAAWERSHPTCLPAKASRSLRYGLSYYAQKDLAPCSDAQENLPLLKEPNK